MKKLTVWLFTDPYASMGSTQEEEYDNIEKQLTEMLPGLQLTFHRDKQPSLLSNANPDLYVFDVGGMCKVDFGGHMRRNWAHNLMRQIDDHPNTLFIPWSQMTGDSIRSVMQEFLPEWDDPEAELPEPPTRHNVWLPPATEKFNWWKYKGLKDRIEVWK
jgi:hypothetical protein